MTGIDEIIKLFSSINMLIWLPPFLCMALIQSIIIIQLIWRSVGIIFPIRKTIIPSIIMLIFVWTSRIIITVPYHMFVTAFFMILLITIYSKINILYATIGTLFVYIVIIIGSVIFIEPILFISTNNEIPFFFKNLPNYFTGIVLETVFPLLVLFFFVHKKIVLLKVPQGN